VSRIASVDIVPVPLIKAAGQTFRGRLEISLAGIDNKPVNLYYTTDGSEPNENSQKFAKPFFIDADTTVKARAIAADGKRSPVVTSRYHRIPHDWQITMQSRYSSQYTGGGDFALVDGIRGTTNWSGGAWQGYQGKDLVAVVDLGRVQALSKVGAGFLQDVGSWIWMPSRVEIELSLDGKSFNPALSISNEISERQEGVVIRDFVQSIPLTNARYVRIRAVNVRAEGWIFVDEVIVEAADSSA
jgi:hypothetical protein